MLTFKPIDRNFVTDLSRKGYSLFVDELTHDTVLVTHANENGVLSSALQGDIPRPDLIICCYPARAAKRYPHLRFAGDWDSKTRPVLTKDGFFIYSEEEVAMCIQ